MDTRAAVLVDTENVSGKQQLSNVHQFLETTCSWYHAQVEEFAVHGHIQTHLWWRHPNYHISYYQHAGGKNAADAQIRQHASALMEEGFFLFYLVSNDKHLAAVADLLEAKGCEVLCLGTRLAARALQRRANFFFLDQKITRVYGSATPTDLPPQGETMTPNHYQSPSTRYEDDLTSQERVKQALQIIYSSTLLPDLYVHVFSLFLEWSLQGLSLSEPFCTGSVRNPAEISTILKDIEQDPLLSLCITAEVRPQWDAAFAFAKRCEYAYASGYEAGFHLGARAPHLVTSILLQTPIEKKGQEWEQELFSNLPDEQQRFFRHIEMTERLIWQRWYHHGAKQGTQEQRDRYQKAWTAKQPEANTESFHI